MSQGMSTVALACYSATILPKIINYHKGQTGEGALPSREGRVDTATLRQCDVFG